MLLERVHRQERKRHTNQRPLVTIVPGKFVHSVDYDKNEEDGFSGLNDRIEIQGINTIVSFTAGGIRYAMSSMAKVVDS